MDKDIMEKLEAALSKFRVTPHPDTEVIHTFWDEKTQSVKQSILAISDMYEQPAKFNLMDVLKEVDADGELRVAADFCNTD